MRSPVKRSRLAGSFAAGGLVELGEPFAAVSVNGLSNSWLVVLGLLLEIRLYRRNSAGCCSAAAPETSQEAELQPARQELEARAAGLQLQTYATEDAALALRSSGLLVSRRITRQTSTIFQDCQKFADPVRKQSDGPLAC